VAVYNASNDPNNGLKAAKKSKVAKKTAKRGMRFELTEPVTKRQKVAAKAPKKARKVIPAVLPTKRQRSQAAMKATRTAARGY